MKEYVFEVTDEENNVQEVFNNTMNKASFAEKRSFIWIVHPNLNFMSWKTEDGANYGTFNSDLNLFLIIGRPVFFDDSIEKQIIFREYKP